MNRLVHASLFVSVVVLSGCPKSGGGDAPDAAPVVTSSAAPATSGSAASPATSPSSLAAKTGGAASWSLKYTLAPATLYVGEKDAKSVKFKNDTEKYVGDGTLTLAVDATGRVTGESTAPPLGAAVVSGVLSGDTLSAQIRRKDPADEGLTGTLTAKVAGDKLDGALKLAESNAAVVREGKLSGTKK